MSLDDALWKYDTEQDFNAQWRAQQEAEAKARRERFIALVQDFLSRMNRAGSPGTDWNMKEGFFRKVKGWALTYEVGDAWRRIVITVDGRVPSFSTSSSLRFVPVAESDFSPGNSHLATLGNSMAELMRRHGVS